MPTRTNGRAGSYVIERVIPFVGSVKRSSGTSDLKVFRQIELEIAHRIREQDWPTLRALQNGELRGIDLLAGIPRRALKRLPPMMLYFIRRDDTREIKIGVSRNVARRVKDLQTAQAVKLVIVLAVPGNVIMERLVHQQFATDRKGQEWFAETPELLQFIAELGAET